MTPAALATNPLGELAQDLVVFAGVLPPAIAERGPRLGDDIWDFRDVLERRAHSARIDFTSFPAQFRWPCRLFAYRSLHHPAALPWSLGPGGVLTVYAHLKTLRRVLDHLATVEDVQLLAGLTQTHLDNWLAARQGQVSLTTLRGECSVLLRLAAHSTAFPSPADRVGFRPWNGRSPVTAPGRGENRTPRIPEDVMRPLLWWAVAFVRHADDLFAARHEAAQLSALVQDPKRGPTAAVTAEIHRRRQLGRGIPISYTGGPNYTLVARQGGARSSLPRLYPLIDAAAAELGLEPGGLDTPLTVDTETGMPWHPPLDPRHAANYMPRYLGIACAITVAYLSGLRHSELANLTHSCREIEAKADGTIQRRRITGRVYKQKARGGTLASWTVLAVVHDAVDVICRLHPGDHNDLLFPTLLTTNSLNEFAAHCSRAAQTLDLPDLVVPNFRLNWRQLRRTLAWHIANRPFGVVAGMIQYQHASVTLFEGYAGTSASGFRAEVDAETLEAQLLHEYDLVLAGIRGQAVLGAHAQRLVDNTQHRFDHDVIVRREADVAAFLRANGAPIHSTPTNYCLFRAETARCLDLVPPDQRTGPIPHRCDPFGCPNAAITPTHQALWQAERSRLADHLSGGRRPIPTLQRQILEDRLRHVDEVLVAITPKEQS